MEGQGSRQVKGWYLPVRVPDERMGRHGVRVRLLMRRVAEGEEAGGYIHSSAIRIRVFIYLFIFKINTRPIPVYFENTRLFLDSY